jgi:cytoskeletal protein CcmA (bactofilin family)
MSWFRKRAPSQRQLAVPEPAVALPAGESLEIFVDGTEVIDIEPMRTVIAIDTTVRGVVTTASDLLVAGQIDGDIESGAAVHVASEGAIAGDITALRVRVDAGAGVDGEIHANDVHIDGRVRGNVAAGGRLALGERAEVIGDVRARTLLVDEGATLQGRCTSG